MAKWTALTVVHYRVVGEYSGGFGLHRFTMNKIHLNVDAIPNLFLNTKRLDHGVCRFNLIWPLARQLRPRPTHIFERMDL